MEALVALVIMAILVEGVVDGIKGKLTLWQIVPSVLAAILCPLAGLDIFALLGIPLAVPVVGSVLTGAIIGRGSSAVHGLLDKLGKAKSGEPPDGTEAEQRRI